MAKNSPSLRNAFVVVAGLSITASPALPQQADKRVTEIEEVVVTARRVEESLQDSPVSVAAFSTRDLENMGVSQAGDVAEFTPNLVMRKQSSSQSNYAIAIRGISSGETALAIDPTVAIYQDGVYIARTTGAAFDIVDLERIEVLRGPQGTLFGRNTVGGAINVITEKPRDEFSGKLQAGYGARSSENLRGTLDLGRYTSDSLGSVAVKLSALRNVRGDGTHESLYTGGDIGQFTNEAQRVAINWMPTETVSADYAYERSRDEGNTLNNQISGVRDLHVSLGGPYYAAAQANASSERQGKLPIQNTADDESTSDIDLHALTLEFDVTPNFRIKSISSYREWHSLARGTDFGSFRADGFTLIDFAGIYTAFPGLPVPAGTLVPIFAAERESVQRQTTQEFQFIGSAFNDRLNYVSGLYFFEERAHEDNPQQLVLPGPFTGFLPPGTSAVIGLPFFSYATDNEAYAVYSNLSYTVMPELDVTLGLRYSVDKKETTLTNTLASSPGAGDRALRTATDDESWNQFNPSLTADYRWNENVSTYATVSTGYRSGGYNVRADNVESFKKPFDEETVTSFELGMKSDLLDRRLRINAAVFQMIYQDRQIAAFEAGSGGASTNIVNAGESENSGFEVETMYVPLPGVRLLANYGYIHVKYNEFETTPLSNQTGSTTSSQNQDISDDANRNLYAPEHNASAAIEYELAPWNFGTLSLRLGATYSSAITFHPQLDIFDEAESRTLVNARATLSDIPAAGGRMKVVGWGKNITNEEYREFGIDFGSLGFAINNYGELASWGVDFIYEFNR